MSFRFHQQGAALLVSLVILLILSIIGISAMRGGLLQTLMATNTQQLYMAQNASDSAAESMYYTVNVQRLSAGNFMSDAKNGIAVNFSVGADGSLSAAADTYFDAGRDRTITQGQASLEFLGCSTPGAATDYSLMCPGSSGGTKPNTSAGCNVFRTDATGQVGDLSAQTELWMSAYTAC
jgi:type IV pilus assembly protein PilX